METLTRFISDLPARGPSPPAGFLWADHLAESPTAGGRTHLDHPLPEYQRYQTPDRAFGVRSARQFPNWQAVRDADPGAIVAAIRTAGLANQKRGTHASRS